MEQYIPRRQPSRMKLFRYRLAAAGVPVWAVIAIGTVGMFVLGLTVYSIMDATGPSSAHGWKFEQETAQKPAN